ncbi:Ribosomal RNA-processing protein 7-like A [Vitis vinifera]|uniref:Ribosomal RNA-processing protein 7-like A n=1 Tax=Vitis vinifera TaxID=29760 RepID=A0A438EAB8_VITVI|nr:Ribosomal RNA-processing protein 7-like A [Vitis vinifera]
MDYFSQLNFNVLFQLVLFVSGENVDKVVQENKSSGKKKRKREKGNQVHAGEAVKFSIEEDKSNEGERKRQKNKSSRKKNRKNEEKNRVVLGKVDRPEEEVAGPGQSKTQSKTENSNRPEEASVAVDMRTSKSKKAAKNKEEKITKSSKKQVENEPDEVYHISSGDEDCSKGMKKWIMEYHQSRPGLKILQQRIDEFITAHEAEEEQARKEREARASEGGWTVVVHHKGRKKTTDSESGIAVGSVAQAAVMDKMGKKKSKEIGLNFYRFQRREAQRNELMMLQSKFEQDKKRIQQLRAARKFRPY